MKQLWILGLCVLLSSGAFAQTQTTLDVFENYANTSELVASGWAHTGGWTNPVLVTTDGAAGSTSCMELQDAGYAKGVEKDFLAIVPANGNYKMTFYYKNGHTGNPWEGLAVRLNGDIATEVTLGSATVAEWTAGETGTALDLLAGATITVEIYGISSAQADNNCRFDELILEEVPNPPIVVSFTPFNGYWVSGTELLTAQASGGAGSYAQAEFDIGADGSVESTDSTPGDGFTYSWDTTSVVSGGTAEVEVKVIITDVASATGAATYTYTVDNRSTRVEMVLNGDFEAWSDTLPDNWNKVDLDADGNAASGANSTVTKETAAPFAGSNSLRIAFTASDYTYRYTMLSDPFPGDYLSYFLTYWGKGGSDCRLCYFESDDGIAWISSWRLLANSSTETVWARAVDAAWNGPGTAYMAIATHMFVTAPNYWDEISITASQPPPTPTPTDTPVVAGTGNTWHDYR